MPTSPKVAPTLFTLLLSMTAPSLAWQPGASQPDAIRNLSVDTSDRSDVVSFFHCIYAASEGGSATMNWTGSIANCQAGTTSAVFKDHVLRRINWFRAMTGVPADISFSADRNDKSQKAALIMSAQRSLSHNPPTDWACYSADGRLAASKGNLFLGVSGVEAIDGYIEDPGSNNTRVGHRRWLLYPQNLGMGTGDVPATPGFLPASCIWVIGNNRSPRLPAMATSWPPEGFVPWQTIYPRWSFSYGGADFSQANVTFTKNGQNVTHTIENRTGSGIGDNTIVWNAPSTVGSVTADTTYNVTISGIRGSGPASVSYNVTVINPEQLGQDVSVAGPDEIGPSGGDFSFNTINAASSYELSVSRIAPNNTTEGAEDATAASIIDNSGAHTLRITDGERSGSKCFHLTPVDFFKSENFELDRNFKVTSSSELRFYARRGFASATTPLRCQVSTDGGGSWQQIWQLPGTGQQDSGYTQYTLPLSSYAGLSVRVRFLVEHTGGQLYPGTNTFVGFRIDDISFTNSDLEVGSNITSLGNASGFTLNSSTAGAALIEDSTYLLKIRPVVGCHTFGFGAIHEVLIGEDAPDPISPFDAWRESFSQPVGGLTADDDGDGIENGIEYVLQTHPLQENEPSLIPEPVWSGNTVTMTVPDTADASGVLLRMSYSTNLHGWDYITDSDSGSDSVFTMSTTGMEKLYLRLSVVHAN